MIHAVLAAFLMSGHKIKHTGNDRGIKGNDVGTSDRIGRFTCV